MPIFTGRRPRPWLNRWAASNPSIGTTTGSATGCPAPARGSMGG